MLQNRYADTLREYNQGIINLSPANQTLRIELALEIKKILAQNPDVKTLELGVGEGDLTKYILQYNPDIQLDCLDVSSEMIASAKKNVGEQHINFIQADAYDFLDKEKENTYGIITSAWTFHNFPWEGKKKLFPQIYKKLLNGGAMILMDKIYTDNPQENMRLLEIQNKRHRYLPPEAEKAIVTHELQDFDTTYRMQESQTRKILEEIGFRGIEILDRVERDVLLYAKK